MVRILSYGLVLLVCVSSVSAATYILEDRINRGGGSTSWNDLTDIPAGFADNVDDTGAGGLHTNLTEADVDAFVSNNGYLLDTGDTATGDYNFDSNTFFIDSVNNRVGVGTITPSYPLEVNGIVRATNLSLPGYISGSGILKSRLSDIIISNDLGGNAQFRLLPYLDDIYFENLYEGDMYFRTDTDTGGPSTVQMFIDGNNNRVGIGTTSPSQKLEVSGNIKLSEGDIIVDGGGIQVDYDGAEAWLDASGIVGQGNNNFNYRPTLNGTGNQQTMTLVPTLDPQGTGQTLYSINMNVRAGGATSNNINNVYSLFTQGQLIENYGGTVSNWYGLRVNGVASETSSQSPTVTNQWGVYVNDPNIDGTSLTVAYGSNMNSGTGKYGLYLTGTATNYVNGNLGLGTINPSATLDVVGTIESTSLSGTYGSGSAYVCVYNNGTLFASDGACP